LITEEKKDDIEKELDRLLSECYGYPEDYAKAAFPWGEKDGPLEHNTLREWQFGYLRELGEEIRARGFDGIEPVDPILDSTSSGHGIGKSALTGILTKFIHDTRPHSSGIVTANTSTQLKTRTWAELGKWHRMSLTRHRSDYYASRGNMSLVNVWYPESWRVDAFTCREENSEAFAGNHANSATPFYIFDEASAIPAKIWEVAYGGLTDGEPMWLCFGNGTRNSGTFYETHNRNRDMWRHRTISSMDVEGTNHKLLQSWIDAWGWDSDFVKVRVRGLFPNSSSLQFIDTDLVEHCMGVNRGFELRDPLIYGVDVARFGDDSSVIVKRRGRKVLPIDEVYQKGRTTQLVARIAAMARQEQPDAIFVDGGGVGGGVIDLLTELNVANVIEINGASKPTGRECANMRAQCWWNMREDGLANGHDFPPDEDLRADLTQMEFGYRISDNRILLERKDDAKKRGIHSPDRGDAVALTYALPVGLRAASSRELGGNARAGRPPNLVTDN